MNGELSAERAEWIRRIVDAAPPLAAEQRAALRRLLPPVAAERRESRP